MPTAAAAGGGRCRCRRMGTARYVALAGVLRATALVGSGDPIDLASIDQLLAGLPRVAALEAWRVTAQLAAAAGSIAGGTWPRPGSRAAAPRGLRRRPSAGGGSHAREDAHDAGRSGATS